MYQKMIRWGGGLLLATLAFGAIAALFVYQSTEARLSKTYSVDPTPLSISTDSTVIAQGRHVVTTRGCGDCHGSALAGSTFVDDPLVGTAYAPNLTSGKGGAAREFSTADWVRAMRHGIGTDGQPLAWMPSYEYYYLSDRDLQAVIAYLKNLPPVDRPDQSIQVGPLMRALLAFDEDVFLAAEHIDHGSSPPEAPPRGPTAAYGEYLSKSCIGCHGSDLTGGPIPAAPPDWPPAANITPDSASGIGTWTKADFVRALREGVRPNGATISPIMPEAMGRFTDAEVTALWKYLQTVSPKSSAY